MKFLKGWIGEKKTTFNMWLSLNSKTYRRFHNVILPSKNGTTQIDHVIISPYGLFIVETKNKKGWIFGSENQSKWTQTLFTDKYVFQNPLRQTYRQKKVLSEFLNLNDSIIFTIVYFVGDCEFKTPLPSNVIKSRLGRYIKKFKDQVLSPEEIKRIINELEQFISESSLTKRDHLRSLNQRHSSKTTCPRCGSALMERKAMKGPKAGSKFMGCAAYPKCRFTRNI